MIIDGPEALEKLKEIGAICRDVRMAMGEAVRPGITPLELDAIAEKMFAERGARSAPILAYKFPGQTCISVHDAVAHGIPGDQPLVEGQLVNIDVSAEKDGVFADTGESFAIGKISPDLQKLLDVTKDAQRKAMFAARAGQPVNVVGKAVQKEAYKHNYKIIEGLNGHGVGGWIHEEPTVPNLYYPRDKEKLVEGQVITIEPFLTTESRHYVEDADGWTLRLAEGGFGAQFEHTFVVTKGAPIVVTQ
ncbi:type I methionyl aminopeptidase [Kordiimonas laminariae]|uniref:type I methionyl aminopeptidase n=1 Tax=Kordiimonas laminariae TaxID=2917717 RepID=UPI001FF59466|nr:type I methionyl aminopeptidase [Kordiimonas laminariae]MCK0068633.1 type I methionyl aminopeptidase [Kordiimonas laminariae]